MEDIIQLNPNKTKSNFNNLKQSVENNKLGDLTDDQKEAFKQIKDWLEQEDSQFYALMGYAGVGKTYMLDFITKYAKNELKQRVAVTATTNKAVKVLKDKVRHSEMFTIHSLLNIRPVRKGTKEIFKPVDYNKNDIEVYNLVIIDEASMVSSEDIYEDGEEIKSLLTIIKEEVEGKNVKVLFCGDPAQLQPINENISKCFEYDGFKLTKIVRHGDVIANVSKKVREVTDVYVGFDDLLHPTEVDNITVQQTLELFKDYKKDPNNVRLLCWTNARVKYWNRVLRIADYGYEPEKMFIKGDVILANDSCEVQGGIITMMNKDEGVIEDVEEHDKYFQLEVKKESGHYAFLNVLKEEYKKEHARELHELAKKKHWREFWSKKKFFHDIRHCYAMTVHASQGSTFKNVVLHKNDIDKNRDIQNRNQLVYVGITRASDNVYFL